MQEFDVYENPFRDEIVAKKFQLKEGYFDVPSAPGLGIEIDETRVPVRPQVQSACELLGLDPVYVANEGKVVFFVAPEAAEAALAVLRAHPLGRDAAIIGRVVSEHPQMLVAADSGQLTANS